MTSLSLSSVSNYIPSIGLPSPQQACRNVTKLAVPIIALAFASIISAAEAITYAECMNNCNAHRDITRLLDYCAKRCVCYLLKMIEKWRR